MSNNELEVKIKIGEIEFYAKGQTADVEAQRQNFTNIILPAAVDAIKSSRTSQTYIAEAPVPVIAAGKEETIIDTHANLSTMSINEFIKSKGFKSQIDIAMGLIYFHEKCKGNPDFTSDDLKQFFKDARISPAPKNPSDVVNRLVGKSFIMSGDDKKRYYLTQTGISFIEGYVPKETKAKKAGTTKPRKKRAKADSVYASLSADDLNLKKYPDIKSFKDFKDKMMLVLYIVKEEGHGDEFSMYDVQTLMTDILGHPATKGQVQGVFDRNATWFKNVDDPTNKKSVKHKLLIGAIEYAKELIASNAKDD